VNDEDRAGCTRPIEGDAPAAEAPAPLDPDFQPMLALWHETRGARALPVWRDFRPERMARDVFGRLFLVEVVAGAGAEGPDFRYGLVGETLVDTFGRRVTGRLVGPDVFGAAGDAAVAFHREMVRRRRPCLSRGHAGWDDLRIRYEAVYLPFARAPGGDVSVFVSLMRFLARRPHGQSATLNAVFWQDASWL
jgi:hypothetical protein